MVEALHPLTMSTFSLGEIQITTAIYPLTPCQTVGMSQACADHPPPTSTPTSLQISPRLSPRPPTSRKKITLGSLQGPDRGPCQAFAFIAVWTGGKRAQRAGSYLREWKVGGVKGVNATQREVRKGKLAIHEAFGRGPFFLRRGGLMSTLEP